jgi:hypothetical protein
MYAKLCIFIIISALCVTIFLGCWISSKPIEDPAFVYVTSPLNSVKSKEVNEYDPEPGKVWVHKVEGTMCGEIQINKTYLRAAKVFIDLRDGGCRSEGFTVVGPSREIYVPVMGRLTINMLERSQVPP